MEKEVGKAKQLNLFSAFDTIPLLDEFDREYELKVLKSSAIMKDMVEKMGYGMTSEKRMLRSPAVYLTDNMLEPQSFEARPYIVEIVRQALRDNSIIILPTGLGKTYAAILLTVEVLKINLLGKILLLAPTRPLCEQHQKTFSKVLPKLSTEFLTGKISAKKRPVMWQESNVIIATPETIAEELNKKSGVGNALDISLLLIDETHHLTGNYAYSPLATYYYENNPNILIAGFTASPDSEIEKLIQLQNVLHVADSQVLVRSYNSPDVKPYVFIRFIRPIFIEKNTTEQQHKYKTMLVEVLTRSFKRLSDASGESLFDYAYKNEFGKVVGIRITAFNSLMKRLKTLVTKNNRADDLRFVLIDWALSMKIGNAIDRLQKGMPEFIFFMQKQFANWHLKKTPSGTQFVNHHIVKQIMAEIISPAIRLKLTAELIATINNLGLILKKDMTSYIYQNEQGQDIAVLKQAFKELGNKLKEELAKKSKEKKSTDIVVKKLTLWSLAMRIQALIDCLDVGIQDLVNYLICEYYAYQSNPKPSCQLLIKNQNIREVMAWLVHYNFWKERNYPPHLEQFIDTEGEIDWEEAWHDPKLSVVAEIIDSLEHKQMLIFVKYRDTLRKVIKYIEHKYPNITCDRLTGTANNYGDPGMKQKKQKEVLEKYKNKKIKILVSTSIGEEGLDFPSVDELVFYEPISDVRRHIQRLGRTARRRHGNVHILIYKDSDEESIYYTSRAEERAVRKIIQYYEQKTNQKIV